MGKLICLIKSIKLLKVLWILFTILLCLIWIYPALYLSIFLEAFLNVKIFSESNEPILYLILVYGGFIILTIFSIIEWKRIKKRCMKCKKIGALVLMEEKPIGKTEINIPMKIEMKNNDGEVTGTTTQYISGYRVKYRKIYKCKYCGENTIVTYTKDKPNT